MPKLTERERQERKLQREAEKQWRRALCVELARDAIEANRAETGEAADYLSRPFQQLLRNYTK